MRIHSAVRLLDEAAARFADRCAVEDETTSLTYAQYRDTARKIGAGLLAAGAVRRPVVVYLPKSARALCVFLGAQYAGCPYAPVDAHIPMARLDKIIDSLRPGCIVTDGTLVPNLEGLDLRGAKVCLYDSLAASAVDEERLDAAAGAVNDADPIYIMYTSGSTGTPKGVTIPHRGILDYADWVVKTFGFTEETVMAGQAPFYFDNSTFDIYGSIRCGGKLVLIPDALVLYPLRLPQFLAEKEITAIFWVPTVLINIANSGALEGADLPALRTVAFCGEVMPNKQLNVWRRALPGRTFANLYGPTEITDVCCYYIVDREFADSDPLPIGKACENMRVLILREDGTEAAAGEQGELCVLGSGVALGYWNAPELTARAFCHNPANRAWGERMYRTGDLAFWDGDGLLQFCGRRDNQIKLKGNRIELGELETAAMCVEGVENAAAVFDKERERIVLFVETQGTLPLRRFNLELKKHIPQYMLPGQLVPMEKLPHTPNDKIDRQALKAKLDGEGSEHV